MHLLGIDIGGSGIKGALVDPATGQLVGDRFRIPTPDPATPDAVADVVAAIVEHFKYSDPLGITFPGIVTEGIIKSAANVDDSWMNVDARQLFSKKLNLPVQVLNDADAAGIAEVRFGAAKDRKGVVILATLGTGIGTALFMDGVLVPNTEFGHLHIRGKDAEKRASDRVREEKDLSWHDWANAIAEFLNEMDKLFSPGLFVIGGGVSKKADKFLPHLQAKCPVEIVPAQMQNAAGIIGAACAAPAGNKSSEENQ